MLFLSTVCEGTLLEQDIAGCGGLCARCGVVRESASCQEPRQSDAIEVTQCQTSRDAIRLLPCPPRPGPLEGFGVNGGTRVKDEDMASHRQWTVVKTVGPLYASPPADAGGGEEDKPADVGDPDAAKVARVGWTQRQGSLLGQRSF